MKKIKIILVENDEDEQLFMREGFESSGLFEIRTMVKNGDVLFEWMAENPNRLPEIILTDLNMPGKNGYDIIETIKTTPAYEHIPVIITSTSSTRSTVEKCYQLGASAYVVKPDTFIEYVDYAEKLHHMIQEKQLVSN